VKKMKNPQIIRSKISGAAREITVVRRQVDRFLDDPEEEGRG
jgi:hypothetical protein